MNKVLRRYLDQGYEAFTSEEAVLDYFMYDSIELAKKDLIILEFGIYLLVKIRS